MLFRSGNLTIPATVTSTTGNLIVFAKTSGSQAVFTNGITIAPAIQVIGGSTVSFNDALTASSTFTFTLGTLQFKAGVTSSAGTFVFSSGTTQKTLQSTSAGSQATISQTSGTVNCNYLTVKDCVATGGAIYNAFTGAGSSASANNINSGNNIGWNFIPAGSGFLSFF